MVLDAEAKHLEHVTLAEPNHLQRSRRAELPDKPKPRTHFMNEDISSRLGKIESHVAHLEHQFELLNGVVIEQGKLLERLKKEVQRQSSAMETLELERIKANNSKPPHYQ